MSSEKGNLVSLIKKIINKIKLFFKRKKEQLEMFLKKRKEEKEKKRLEKINGIRPYSKIEIVGKTTLGFFGGIFSSIFKKNNKEKDKEINIEKELKHINRNILNIENQIEHETTPIILKMYKKQINKNIEKMKNLKNIKSREDNKKVKDETKMLLTIKDKITDCENKIKGIKDNNVNKKIEVNDFLNKKNNDSKLKKIGTNIKKTGAIISIPIIGFISNLIPKKTKTTVEENHIKNKIKNFNNKINKTYTNVSKIKNSKYNESKEIELLVLKDKILDLKKEYFDLLKNEEFIDLKKYKDINMIDPNHLSYHDKAIDNLIDYIDTSINEIKGNQKENINDQNKIEKIEVKENTFQIDQNKIEIILKSAKRDILISGEEIKQIKATITNASIKLKKKTVFNSLSNFFRNSINIGISLIPFGIFKNKLFATLTSGVILNNRIRHMRSIINNSEVYLLDYENILNSINNKKNCLEKTSYVLTDTISEVSKLKVEIEKEFLKELKKYPEISKLLLELQEMEEDLQQENMKLEETIYDISEENIKQKIKKL